MPKFKQLTATNIKSKRSTTSGQCETNEGSIANCSDHQYDNQTDCLAASETWTASFTKVTCEALVPYDEIYYRWEGDKYIDLTNDYIVNVDLEKIQKFGYPMSPISKLIPLTTHTLVEFTNETHKIKKTLAEWMEIMAVEVK